MDDIERYKQKKMKSLMKEATESTRRVGLMFGEACHTLAYLIRKQESQRVANERNNGNLHKQ